MPGKLGGQSRRSTTVRLRPWSRYRATRSIAAKKIQRRWRAIKAKPRYGGGYKSKRSLNGPNTNRFKGRNMVQHHDKTMSKLGFKVMQQLSNAGVIEKRLISHSQLIYQGGSQIATLNPKLASMSGLLLNYGSNQIPQLDYAQGTGITSGFNLSGFQISSGTSGDKYVFYKNFQSELTITTEAANFSGAPDPTNAAQLGFVNTLNFRVLLLQRRVDAVSRSGVLSSGAGNTDDLSQAHLYNSLFLGYDGVPFGLCCKLGEDSTAPAVSRDACGIDVLTSKINHAHWNVLQDKRFPLSVPVANVAGAESKYPNMKKLVFTHPVMEKVQVVDKQSGIFPKDWNDNYMCIVLCGLPNSSNAFRNLTTPSVPIPKTAGLWKATTRGFTSYMDA